LVFNAAQDVATLFSRPWLGRSSGLLRHARLSYRCVERAVTVEVCCNPLKYDIIVQHNVAGEKQRAVEARAAELQV
jgi:hypothetical protein